MRHVSIRLIIVRSRFISNVDMRIIRIVLFVHSRWLVWLVWWVSRISFSIILIRWIPSFLRLRRLINCLKSFRKRNFRWERYSRFKSINLVRKFINKMIEVFRQWGNSRRRDFNSLIHKFMIFNVGIEGLRRNLLIEWVVWSLWGFYIH